MTKLFILTIRKEATGTLYLNTELEYYSNGNYTQFRSFTFASPVASLSRVDKPCDAGKLRLLPTVPLSLSNILTGWGRMAELEFDYYHISKIKPKVYRKLSVTSGIK